MRKVEFNLTDVKEQIASLKGQGVDLEVNIGRKKIRQFTGTIKSVYPSVFTFVDLDGNLKTYSYSDILCGDVKILNEEQA
ncbi:MAG: Veg family protein [Clostridia bacterium]|nr:Veg family protein [Clostridia bacterium]